MTDLSAAISHVEAALGCNRFLYWLGRIPLLRRLFPPSLYAAGPAKNTLMNVVRVFKWLYSLAGKCVYLLIALAVPLVLVFGGEDLSALWPVFLWEFFWLSLVCGSVLQPPALEATALKYVCVLQLRLPARDFIRIDCRRRYARKLITFLPALILAALAFGRPWWLGVVLTAVLGLANAAGDGLHVALYRRWGVTPSANPYYIVFALMAFLILGYWPVLGEWTTVPGLALHPVVIAAVVLAGLLSLVGLRRFRDWYALVKKCSKPENISYTYAKAKAGQNSFRDVQLKTKDLTVETEGDSKRTGWYYLNDLFFRRHRRLLARPTRIADGILGALCVAGLVACLLAPELGSEILTQILTHTLPYLVFLAYFLFNTLGMRICKAMFYNCDLSLLRYSWYRTPAVVLKNFTIRLSRLLALNLSVSLILGAGLVGMALLARLPLETYGGTLAAYVISLQLLAVVFAVHPLFLYYVFQPYTSDLNVKNPFFSTLNWAMYAVCYACVFLDQPPAGFALLVMGVTVVYTAVALAIVRSRAPRTFRVK